MPRRRAEPQRRVRYAAAEDAVRKLTANPTAAFRRAEHHSP